MRRRRFDGAKNEWVTWFAIAFGLGLFLALFCSLKLVLLVAAGLLICMGIKCIR